MDIPYKKLKEILYAIIHIIIAPIITFICRNCFVKKLQVKVLVIFFKM
jgi:hypothetical protein